MAMCTSLTFSGSQFTFYMGITMPTTQCDKFERNSTHLLQGWGK